MKLFSLLLLGLLILSCQNKPSQSKTSHDAAINFDWLLGSWQRTNDKAGRTTYENWIKINPKAYAGHGFTLMNGDTIQQEKIQLIKDKEEWMLIVRTTTDGDQVTFKLVELSDNAFSCENKAHDFPTHIKYWMKDNQLKALVSGQGMEIPFEFEKVE